MYSTLASSATAIDVSVGNTGPSLSAAFTTIVLSPAVVVLSLPARIV